MPQVSRGGGSQAAQSALKMPGEPDPGELFGTASGIGSRIAARVVVLLTDGDTIAQSSAVLAQDLLDALGHLP
jgi:hypothetical protein